MARLWIGSRSVCCAGWLSLWVVVGASASGVVVGGDVTEEEKAAGFVSMFNDQDFTGWKFTGDTPDEPPKNWAVKDGVIQLSGGGKPHLRTADEYADFEMRFEWRAKRERYNSGFFIRSPKNLGKNQLNLAKGNEGKFIGGKLSGAQSVPDLQKPPGEWNEWRVLVVGDAVTFWCNGQLAWKGTGLQPEKGYLGLQAEGAPLEFRKLRIRQIK